MAIFKCKMCGGQLEIESGATVCECEYCGTKQTLPKTDNEQNLNMFNRANHFRQQCEFDKASEIYERMTPNSDDAELFWSIVLCRYGIEYVDDPKTGRKIPTCHRTQFKSILEDADYLEALNRADAVQRSIYESEAGYIDSIQKGILEISNKEEPFDIFICYKESDESGKRTQDSVIAQDLYYQLTQEGFKVFFSRITLESKLGAEYEPYIFAALNSAKVMVVVGTRAEYFNAVWVKNEWSRYLMLMQEDKRRTLIPAYKDMDPYDLPDALSMFQA
ncbi:MAG: toll/interleukin-1 receptor domain-containing protein [Bacteroides sp.]|nr:toll/interleukin-1 receptor domain-containing protein [Eubacterium sp.]MCM1419393.1 toll/interleukin-1 receptor domain-containing protein [Roseburia sp.]MCM1463217.1 toll/interleukin-1 receptor domain-containing protein [Bacteroides sp.]